MMKELFFIYTCLVFTLLTGCTGIQYQPLQMQNQQKNKVFINVTFINKGGDIAISEGILQGLVLATNQSFKTSVPLGVLELTWSYQFLNGDVSEYTGRTIITERTKTVIFYPANQDDMFRHYGWPSIEAKNY